jgi:seryl-tRNA synthetase
MSYDIILGRDNADKEGFGQRGLALFGSGHFPAGRDEVYRIGNPEDGGDHKEPLYLAGTSEPSLLAYFKDKILEEKDLPIKVCGVSQCFRSEVGSYGKDTKGIYRIHEFMKVEQVVLCKADLVESDKWLEALRETAQENIRSMCSSR